MNNYLRNLSLLTSFVIVALGTVAQDTNNPVTLIGSRFSYPFIREVISDFKKLHPTIEVQLLERGTDTEENANLIVNAHVLSSNEIRKGYASVDFAKYAIIPVSNSKNPWLAEIQETGLDKKEIKALFFNKEYDAIYNEKKEKERESKLTNRPNVHLFTRDQKACAPESFAAWYGLKQENLLGKRIVGSDLSLLYAVKSDELGVTYNIPVHLYNLETRQPLSEWTIIPIDQNGNNTVDSEEQVYGNLDQLLETISEGIDDIPVAHLNISLPAQINASNQNLGLFVDFLLNEGQAKARKFGFVELSSQNQQKERAKINRKL